MMLPCQAILFNGSTASIDDGMLISTSANVQNLIAGDNVFINNAGKFTDSYIIRKVEPQT